MHSSRLGRVAALLTVALLPSCQSATDPFADLRVDIAASPAVISPRAPAAVTVTVTNRGRRSVTVETNPCPYRFLVATTAGVIVGPEQQICLAFSAQLELQPGAQHVFQATWAATGLRLTWDAPPAVLPPGEYRLIGSVGGLDGSSRSSPLSIQIRE